MEPAALAVLRAVVGDEAIPEPVRALGRPPLRNDAGDVVGELLAVVPG